MNADILKGHSIFFLNEKNKILSHMEDYSTYYPHRYLKALKLLQLF